MIQSQVAFPKLKATIQHVNWGVAYPKSSYKINVLLNKRSLNVHVFNEEVAAHISHVIGSFKSDPHKLLF